RDLRQKNVCELCNLRELLLCFRVPVQELIDVSEESQPIVAKYRFIATNKVDQLFSLKRVLIASHNKSEKRLEYVFRSLKHISIQPLTRWLGSDHGFRHL